MWPNVCCMIPYAELINHENVDVEYDYLYMNGEPIADRKADMLKKQREEKLQQILRKNVFLDELKKDLKNLEEEFKDKE